MRLLKTILILCFFLITSGIVSAGDEPGVLLLNSDRSIEKYRTAQEGFKGSVSYNVSEITIRGYEGDISDLYRQISREPYRLIYCIGTEAYLAAVKHAPEKNIVFSSIINWRRMPEGPHVYGVSNELHPMMQITHFKHIFPDLKNIGVLYSREFNEQWLDLSKDAAKKTGVIIISRAVPDIDQSKEALKELLPDIDAFWLIPDPMIISGKKNLLDLIHICDKNKIPVFSYNDLYAKYGATLIVSADDSTIGRQAAVITEDLLVNREISKKVQLPAGSRITLNLEKVKTFDLKTNDAALDSVNHILE